MKKEIGENSINFTIPQYKQNNLERVSLNTPKLLRVAFLWQ